ncbi:glycosyltransferase family 39 protein [Calothrix sp. UHCC 0171]|uniref:ArnT family glycosyltransferase n=1 Tax=Calothrix sp. UHCC 0171 TaxID=3110245 RepID=UPI002B1F9E1D|nr:glycosyltransferase family 39 protein [Calothrix sp. UHCC 0171]MEA5571529.1 glycosyltransferase family 39 protein [Calothrix sp. UHCC 0171]
MINHAFDRWCKDIEKRPVLAMISSVLVVTLVSGIGFFWHLGSIGLIDETEPLFAEASRQMLVRGDWITPFFNNETRFDKPALIYWCQAIAYQVFGVNEWAVRLPSALAATAVVGFCFYVLQWYVAKQNIYQDGNHNQTGAFSHASRRWMVASLGAALIALSPEMIVWARAGVSDMLLSFCMVSALLCFFLGYVNEEESCRSREISNDISNVLSPLSPGIFPSKWYTAFYILIGGAILTKGPVGIVLPGLIIGIFLLYVGKFKQVLQEIRLFIGLLIIALVSLPWYVLVTWRNGWNFINDFFGYHNVERFTAVVNRHSAPWYFYFLVVLLGFAPYAVYLPSAILRKNRDRKTNLNINFWQRKYWLSQPRIQQFSLFILAWFFGVFGFFTIAVTKLPSYVLPLMPAVGILIALLFNDLIAQDKSDRISTVPGFRLSAWANVIFVAAIGFTSFYVPRLFGEDSAAPNFKQLLQQSNLTEIGGIIWLAAAVILAILLKKKMWLSLFGVNLVAFCLFLFFVLTPAQYLMDSERQMPLRQLSAIAVQNQRPNEELMMVGFKKPSIAFYTQRPINYIRSSEVAGEYIQNQAAKTTQQSVIVFAQPKKFAEMGLQVTDYKILGDRGAYQVIRVPLK